MHSKTTIQPRNKQDKESKEKDNNTKKCSPSSVQLDLLWGRDWSLQSTINEFLQRDTNGLQEISFNKLTKNNPNFYPFSQSHQWTRHSMIFTHPRCLQCFPTQENLTTKTLNPKVTSFVIQVSLSSSSPSKSAKKHLNSTLQPSKSCHVFPNRDTFGAYDPRYDQPYPQNLPSKPKIVSRFPKIVSRLDTLQNMLTALQKSWHASQIVSRFQVFPTSQFWSQLQH